MSKNIKNLTSEEPAERQAEFRLMDEDVPEAHVHAEAPSVGSDRELELVKIYAKSWNTLSFEQLEPYLAHDVVYTSQVVLESLVGKGAVSNYLARKMEMIRNSLLTSDVYAEVGYCGDETGGGVQLLGSAGRPCVLMAQGDIKVPMALVLLETAGKIIKEICICTIVPDPASAIRTGEYPE